MITTRFAEQRLGVSFVTAARAVDALVEVGILHEVTGGQRNRRYSYRDYVALFVSSER